MSQDIQKFLDNCKTIQRIIDVTIEDAHDTHMDQIASAFTFEEHPKLFKFIVTDDNGIPRSLKIIVPVDIIKAFNYMPPIDELIIGANRHNIIDIGEKIYFIRPDIKDSVLLEGYEINPITNPPNTLVNLLQTIRDLPTVRSAEAHRITDPVLKQEANCRNPIVIEFRLNDIHDTIRTNSHINDRITLVVPETKYINPAFFPSIILEIQELIDKHH